jgi:hypothetical protein
MTKNEKLWLIRTKTAETKKIMKQLIVLIWGVERILIPHFVWKILKNKKKLWTALFVFQKSKKKEN